MRLNYLPAFVAIAMSLLIAYGFHEFGGRETFGPAHIGTLIAAFAYPAFTLWFGMAIRLRSGRRATVVRVLAFVFFIGGLTTLVTMTVLSAGLPVLIIGMGLLFLVFALLAKIVLDQSR